METEREPLKTLDEQLAEIEDQYTLYSVNGDNQFNRKLIEDIPRLIAALKLAIEQRNRRIKLTPTNLFAAPLPIDEWIEAEDKELQAILKL